MGSPATWFALVANAALPAFAAYEYAQFALAPGAFDDAFSEALATLFIAQIPLCILGAVFAGVSYVEGPTWRRVVVYVVAVAIIAAISGFSQLAFDAQMGPILGWALVMQLTIIAVAGPQPALARARIDAVARDAVSALLLTVFAGLLGCAVALALLVSTRGPDGVSRIDRPWSDLAWVGAAYFAMRTWSAAYVFTPAFAARGKGYFERPWIEWVIRHSGRSRESDD
ncbi:MAG: hypothetical protein U1F15_07910 [Burkholderiales bacterium]